jgi:hypothetical protein
VLGKRDKKVEETKKEPKKRDTKEEAKKEKLTLS